MLTLGGSTRQIDFRYLSGILHSIWWAQDRLQRGKRRSGFLLYFKMFHNWVRSLTVILLMLIIYIQAIFYSFLPWWNWVMSKHEYWLRDYSLPSGCLQAFIFDLSPLKVIEYTWYTVNSARIDRAPTMCQVPCWTWGIGAKQNNAFWNITE